MFGDIVRAHRQRLGLTQEGLADMVGLSVRGIGKIEAGRVAVPRLRTVRVLADVFGLTGSDRDRFCQVALAGSDGATLDALPPVPGQLPPSIPLLAGRAAELRSLDAVLAGGADAAMVAAIAGMAGVGKTSLAVHWAHGVASRFPDGQIFVNLRGYDAGRPLRPIEALAELLRAVGVASRDVPADSDEAVGVYRSLLQGRRVLVLLDNARNAAQVRPLLPGAAGCLALVTSRDRLTGLVALQHARRVDLEVLSDDASVAVLTPLLGERRVAAAPGAVARLAAGCGNLPLALRIAGARLADRPGDDVDAYVAALGTGRGLDTLRIEGDAEASVAAAFMVSYNALPGPAQRLFRLLGVVPGPSVSIHAAAALTSEQVRTCGRFLDVLSAAHLIIEESAGRYALHDLLRRFAWGLPEGEPGEREDGRRRLLDFYLAAVRTGTRLLVPQTFLIPDDRDDRPAATVALPDAAAAADWLDTELPNLVAAVADAAEYGPANMSWLITDGLRGYLTIRRPATDWSTMAHAGLAAAQAHDDRFGRAAMHLSLGLAHRWRAQFDAAMHHLRKVETLTRGTGWPQAQASAASNMGVVHAELGETQIAIDRITEAITLYRTIGQRASEAVALGNLGALRARLGDLRQSNEHTIQALTFYEETGNLNGQAIMLLNLGGNYTRLGEFDRAYDYLCRALHIHDKFGDRYCMAIALICLAEYCYDTNQYQTALRHAERALSLATAIGDLANMANAHIWLGCIQRALDHTDRARAHCAQALALARQAGSVEPEIEALTVLAEIHTQDGRLDEARTLAEQAATLANNRGYALIEGKALTALAAAHLAAGRPTEATDAARTALTRYHTTGYRPGQTRTLAILNQARSELPPRS